MRRFKILVSFLLVAINVFFCFPISAFADENESSKNEDLATSTVNEDLENMEGFSMADYPYDADGETELLQFYENEDEYYLYVYNPARIRYATDSSLNRVRLGVFLKDGTSSASSDKLKLTFVSGSGEEKGMGHLFLKFKIAADSLKAYCYNDGTSRTYEIIELELQKPGDYNATAIDVSTKYIFTGSGDTLQATGERLKTLELDVHHTYYRNGLDALGRVDQQQLMSCYFSVPSEYFEGGRELVRIEAEWNQFDTKPILVVDTQKEYDKLYLWRGSSSSLAPGSYLYDLEDYQMQNNIMLSEYRWTWGEFKTFLEQPYIDTKYDTYDWLFKVDAFGEPGDVLVSRDELEEYMYLYGWTAHANSNPYDLANGDLVIKTKDDAEEFESHTAFCYQGYMIDLFDFDVSDVITFDPYTNIYTVCSPTYEKHGFGYRHEKIHFDDLIDLNDYDYSTVPFFNEFDKFMASLMGGTTGSDILDIKPIYRVRADDLLGESASDKLLISESDFESFKKVYSEAKVAHEEVILFRYDVSEYYSAEFLGSVDSYAISGRYFEETVYLNFDIIELTFMLPANYYRIRAGHLKQDGDSDFDDYLDDYLDKYPESGDRVPVVSDPSNGIADLVNPNDVKLDIKNLLAFVLPSFGGGDKDPDPNPLDKLLEVLRWIGIVLFVLFLLWLVLKLIMWLAQSIRNAKTARRLRSLESGKTKKKSYKNSYKKKGKTKK